MMVIMYHVHCMLTKSEQKRRTVLDVMNLIVMICFFAHSGYDCATNIVFYADTIPLTNHLCQQYAYLRCTLYEVAKSSLYFMWITQIHTSYKASAYEYSTRFVIIPLYILDMVFLLFVLWLNLYVIRSHNEPQLGCVVEYEWPLLFIFALFDSFFCISTLILFIRPLAKMIRVGCHSGCNVEKAHYREFACVIIKKTSLIFITIASSAIFVPTEFFGYPLIAIDDAINCVCILLMLSLHKDLYIKWCGRAGRVIGWYWYRQTDINTLMMGEIQASDSMANTIASVNEDGKQPSKEV